MNPLPRAIAAAGLLALLILHCDFWHPSTTKLWFGVVPDELWRRVLWMSAAWLYLLFIASRIWREDASCRT